MSSKSEAAKNLVMLGKMLGGVLALAPDLERVGNLEDVEAGLKDRVSALQIEEKRWAGLIETHRADNTARVRADSERRAQADGQIAAMKAEVDTYVKAQQLGAIHIVEDAKTTADDIVAKARNDGDKIEDDARSNVERIGVEIANSKERLKAVNDQIAAREAVLAELKQKLSTLGG